MAEQQKMKGRPPKLAKGETRKMYYDSDLHALLVDRLPGFVQGGRISVPALSEALGYSAFHLYRMLQDNRLSPKILGKLVNLSKESEVDEERRLVEGDLLNFLLN